MADKTIGVGIIGTGRISDLHVVEYLRNPATKIAALCDRDPDAARAKSASWGIPGTPVTDDHRELLARSEVDLVEILIPHHLHLPVALDAVNAGKAVSLQKPMCLSLKEADAIVAAAEGSRRPFKLFENFVFFPPVMKAAELIAEGAIGDPLSIRIKSNAGVGPDAWDVPLSANLWRRQTEKSGGGPLVFDDGHHKFALARHFMGSPEEVHAFIGHSERPDGLHFDAQSIISFRFPGNRIGNLEVVYSPELEISGRYYAQDDRVEITGTKGVIWINCGHGQIGDPPPVAVYSSGVTRGFRDIATSWGESFILSTRHYINVLLNGGTPALTAAEGREILKFALAAERSAAEGRSVRISESSAQNRSA